MIVCEVSLDISGRAYQNDIVSDFLYYATVMGTPFVICLCGVLLFGVDTVAALFSVSSFHEPTIAGRRNRSSYTRFDVKPWLLTAV